MSDSLSAAALPTALLPAALYRCEQTKQLDQVAIESYDIPGIVLMKRAGRKVYHALVEVWPDVEQVIVFCGGGNNGGDGYVIAALAAEQNKKVKVYAVTSPSHLQGDAKRAYDYAVSAGVSIEQFANTSASVDLDKTVIVDAMLGTGLKSAVRSETKAAIEQINQSGVPVIAVDIPSGLCGDTGTVLGCAVKADLTVTFIGVKVGLVTGKGPDYVGRLLFDSLAVPVKAYAEVPSACANVGALRMSDHLPSRYQTAHKNAFGHVLLIGGDLGMGGAIMLAAEACARCGAGLTSVATQPSHVPAVLSRLPEVMSIGIPSGQELVPHLAKPTVMAVGPGLGQSPWSEQMLQQVFLRSDESVAWVLDADALNLLSMGRLRLPGQPRKIILTPHPGEAARLLRCKVADIESDRLAAAKELANTYKASVILKGAGSVVSDGEQLAVITVGNPGMATPGAGDVLTGVAAAMLAQGLDAYTAAVCAASLHGQAGDIAAEQGQRGLMASDLIEPLRSLVND